MRYINRDAFTDGGLMKSNPLGVVIHNDAGAMNAIAYSTWLDSHDKTLGVAHYYIDRETTLRYVSTAYMAWHTGEQRGNTTMLGYEVIESLHKKTTDEEFIANEEATFKQVAEDMLYYNLPIDTEHVFLHRSLNQTSCPHRSWELHVPVTDYSVSDEYGRLVAPDTVENREYLAQYFVDRIKFYADNMGNEGTVIPNSGSFELSEVNLLRKKPSLEAEIIAVIGIGQVINYDKILVGASYKWIRQQRKDGSFAYVIVAKKDSNNNWQYLGTFR